MAVIPAPATFVAGTVPTDVNLNSLRDSANFLLAPPLAELQQTVVQPLTSGVWTPLTFDAEGIDSDGAHSTTVNPSQYVVKTAGWLLPIAGVCFATNATGVRGLRLAKNGTALTYGRVLLPAVSGVTTDLTTSKRVLCAVGDVLEAQAYQNSGAALSTSYAAGDRGSFMDVQWAHT